ncbi:MAG: hypothetical protein FWG27_03955 [Treponema sp.]|nr:hypothetical protein [Treponema sp.]
MKKLILLILLLAAGGAVFFLGWVQYEVPIGSIGVIRSKTHGISSYPVKEGKLLWLWYKLIPTNVSVSVFSIQEFIIPIDFSGILPSGDVYSAMAGLYADFSYNYTISLAGRLKNESLPDLASRENLLNQADLDAYCSRFSKEIESHIRTLLWAYREDEQILKEAQETGTIRAMEKDLTVNFPDMELIKLTVNALQFPDFVLYDAVRELYREYLASQRSNIRDEIARFSLENIQNRRRLDELAGYGDLLSKYPILLQYLAMEKGLPVIVKEGS